MPKIHRFCSKICMVLFVNEPIQFLGTFIIQFNRFSIPFVNFLQRYQVSKIWLEIWLEWKLIPNSYLHHRNIKYQFRIFKVWSAILQFCSSKFGITHKLRCNRSLEEKLLPRYATIRDWMCECTIKWAFKGLQLKFHQHELSWHHPWFINKNHFAKFNSKTANFNLTLNGNWNFS